MSHFIVLVTGDDVEEALAPFDEQLPMERYQKYSREEAIKEAKENIKNQKETEHYQAYKNSPETYIKQHKPREAQIKWFEELNQSGTWTDEQFHEVTAKWFEDEMKDADGNLFSTSNPNAQWDWYQVGGRWDGYLILKDGTNVNQATKGEIDWEKTAVPFAILDKGQWHEHASMGWWGMTSDDKEESVWKDEFLAVLDKLPDDTIISSVDCHI